MGAAAAEPRGLTSGIRAFEDRSVSLQNPAAQISLNAAQALARQDMKLDGDQRAGCGIMQTMRPGDARSRSPRKRRALWMP